MIFLGIVRAAVAPLPVESQVLDKVADITMIEALKINERTSPES